MFRKFQSFGNLIGIFLIVSFIAVFSLWYFIEIKKIENLATKIEKTNLPVDLKFNSKKEEKEKEEISLATSTPNSSFILPPLIKSKEKVFPAKKIIHLPILMYHHINYLPSDAPKVWRDLTVSPEIFAKQMEYLFTQNYNSITFEEFINYLKKEEKIPERALIISFDDGWRNQYQYAFPILKKYNFRATFFVVVNYIGRSSFINWKELAELLNNGMEIGSHTMNHPNLHGLSELDLKYEIKNSKIILEENLRQKINVFAYPYGAFDSQVIKVVRESNYFAARSCIEGVDQDLENLYTLKTIQVYDNLYQFKKIFPPEE